MDENGNYVIQPPNGGNQNIYIHEKGKLSEAASKLVADPNYPCSYSDDLIGIAIQAFGLMMKFSDREEAAKETTKFIHEQTKGHPASIKAVAEMIATFTIYFAFMPRKKNE